MLNRTLRVANVCLVLVCAACAHVGASSGVDSLHAAQGDVKVTRSEVRPWDPEVQKRVVEDMADGKPSKALQRPTLLTRRVPKYPTKALKAGVAGTVRLEARIGLNGKAEHFTVIHGHPELVEAVKAAVAQWRFRPIKVDGRPHEMKAFVDVAFTLR